MVDSVTEGEDRGPPVHSLEPRQRVTCLLCDWYYDVPPLDPRLSKDTLASVFGPGIMIQHAINSQAQKTEEELSKHLSTHQLIEWVQKVSSLKRELELLKATFA